MFWLLLGLLGKWRSRCWVIGINLYKNSIRKSVACSIAWVCFSLFFYIIRSLGLQLSCISYCISKIFFFGNHEAGKCMARVTKIVKDLLHPSLQSFHCSYIWRVYHPGNFSTPAPLAKCHSRLTMLTDQQSFFWNSSLSIRGYRYNPENYMRNAEVNVLPTCYGNPLQRMGDNSWVTS